MTSLKATSAQTLEATFATAVASDGAVTIKVTKAGSTTAVTGTTKWNAELNTVVFTSTAKLTAGTYEMTATDVADSTKITSKTAVVENEKVDQIVIKDDIALTNAAKDEAYIYYDVLNQYGESVKASTTINWTVSTAVAPVVNKAQGKITAKKSATAEKYTYGTSIFVTGVYTKTGANVQKELKVGMEQSLDTVKTAGFLKKTDKSKILDKLPNNFQKDEYVMLYQTFDQNGNPIDAVSNNISSGKVTFICDNPLLMKSDFTDADTVYTIDGVEYCAVKVEPGQYVDKGGEINITAISNNTGNKTLMNYVIGNAGLIKKMVLSQPSFVVSDGEQDVVIPYVAYDMDGKEITNYETIARSTNTLSLTASDGSTLKVKENAQGQAEVVWSDRTDLTYADSTTWDEVDRSIALTTVVVGGESDNLLLQVSDMARPVAVAKVNFRDTKTTAIVENDQDTIDLTDFTFVDQYGRTMGDSMISNDGTSMKMSTLATTFFNLDSWHDSYYGVKTIFNKGTTTNFTLSTSTSTDGAIVIGATGTPAGRVANYTWDSKEQGEVKTETLKFSVVSVKTTDYKSAEGVDCYDDCSKKLNVAYTIVPMKLVSGITIDKLNKQYISLGLEDYKTGAEAKIKAEDLKAELNTTGAIGVFNNSNVKIPATHTQEITVSGLYKGISVFVPKLYLEYESKQLLINTTAAIATINGVSQSALTFGDFFDAKAANLARKDGYANLSVTAYGVSAASIQAAHDADIARNDGKVTSAAAIQIAKPEVTVVISDEAPKPVTIYDMSATKNATNTKITSAGTAKVKDQYEKQINTGLTWKYTISDITENAGDFAHLDSSLAVVGNATDQTSLTDVELGDKYVLTFQVSNKYGNATDKVDVVIGADTYAFISSAGGNTGNDYELRKTLKYAY